MARMIRLTVDLSVVKGFVVRVEFVARRLKNVVLLGVFAKTTGRARIRLDRIIGVLRTMQGGHSLKSSFHGKTMSRPQEACKECPDSPIPPIQRSSCRITWE